MANIRKTNCTEYPPLIAQFIGDSYKQFLFGFYAYFSKEMHFEVHVFAWLAQFIGDSYKQFLYGFYAYLLKRPFFEVHVSMWLAQFIGN